MSENKRVSLPGHGEFWFLIDDSGVAGPLAPLDQCDPEGNLYMEDALFADSYAHCFWSGAIMRHGKQIASFSDLVFL